MNNLPIYDAILGANNEIQLISLVDSPAIQRDFVYFNEEKQLQYFNEDQQMIVTPIIIPDKLIFRSNNTLGEFYTKFSKETIKKINYQYAKDNNFNKSNLNHKDSVKGIIMLQNWIKESQDDKSNLYGFSDLPIGTWFGIYKIDNQDVWNKIKSGDINGVSIEGYLTYQKEEFKQEFSEITINDELKMIFNKEKLVATPQAGESKNDFLGRCIPLEIRKGHKQDQAIAICEVTWTNK
jgi:hypothetical protein